jgi:hypothetical protein
MTKIVQSSVPPGYLSLGQVYSFHSATAVALHLPGCLQNVVVPYRLYGRSLRLLFLTGFVVVVLGHARSSIKDRIEAHSMLPGTF